MRLVSVILGLGLLLAACGSSSTDGATAVRDDDDAATPVAELGESGDARQEPDDEVEDDSRRDPSTPFAEDVTYEADATPFVVPSGPLEAGTYRTGSLGTPVSFTNEEALMVQHNIEGLLVLTDIASRAPDDRDLVFMRVKALSDPTEPNAPFEEQDLWPADDLLGWLESVDEAVVASEPVETTVNGLDAITVDLELAEGVECGFLPGECVGFVIYDRFGGKSLNVGAQYRIWLVEQGEEAPLLILAGISRPEDASWFPRADAVLDTIAFGDVSPHPVQPLDFGSNQLVALGGIDVDLAADLAELIEGPYGLALYDRYNGRGFSFVMLPRQPGVLFLAEEVYSLDGTRLSTPDEVVQILIDADNEVTELDPITIDGAATRVFAQRSTNVWDIPFAYSPLDIGEQRLGWDTPASSTIWLIEHPDRGLMLMSANVWEDDEESRRLTDKMGWAFAESLTFN